MVERYAYDDYGAPTFADATDQPLGASAAGNPYLFRGMRHDVVTGLYAPREGAASVDDLAQVIIGLQNTPARSSAG